ncbi:PLP-dependent aspartate aminotransferase family protein [Neobacillus niacini]|uniref:trans-sulfuration enzyme family protein n=1 Tax=Neobacillus niacini TaxID=86668 RepID=UPI0007AB2D35|nr:PLP-dependent aspartate aminotransferase family protein [Neobacillus niacini]MEC1525665.1 PLP-dependent aspartate aminotransferase family protein [Neobacillus niacini]
MTKQSSNEHIVTHLGDEYDRFHGAVVPPIYQNSLFVFENFEQLAAAMKDEQSSYLYWRGTNPTVEIVEKKLAALEKGERCKLFASGMAAISSAILTFLQSGDHVLSISNIYGPTTKFFTYIEKFGISHTNTLNTDLEAIESLIRPNTKVIYLESPTTMSFKLVDLKAIVALAKQRGIKTIIDNTWATPIFQNPITYGIDIVVHSVSKYLGGHSDLVGGALITSKEIMDHLFYHEYQLFGGVMPPYEAWLLMRGLRTLPIRMKAHQESGLKIASFLEKNPAVKRVNYPGLESSPDYRLGKEQLKGYTGLMSFELKNNTYESVRKVVNSLNHFQIGVSWGGFESLVISPNYGYNVEQLVKGGLDPGLIRISVGLENVDELLEDLEAALKSV